METHVKPTIGRIVLFHPTAEVTQAAIVAYVHSDTLVNLAVFDSNGAPYGKTSVQLVQPGEPKPEFGFYCEWMPYQVDQAKKADAQVSFTVSQKTADALERIIQKVDEQIQLNG